MSVQNNSLPIHPHPYQFSIIDVFFPGFSRVAGVSQQLLAGDVNNYARLLVAFGVFIFVAKYAYRHVVRVVHEHFCLWLRSLVQLF